MDSDALTRPGLDESRESQSSVNMSPLGYLNAAGARADVILPLTWFTLIVSVLVCIVITVLLWAGIRRRHVTTDIRSVPLERGGNGLRWISLGVLISAVP